MPMEKITAADPQSCSPDLIAENLAKLQTLFPEAVTEDGVNVDVLQQLIGKKPVTDAEEKYGLNWHGKRQARQLALTPSTGTLRPCPEESVNWDTTQNLMIEGDNLEVLKLLQKSYAGKVKLIYIDPPYNTGKDFVYPDDFQDNLDNYLQLTGQKGGDGRKLIANPEASGRFHTDWLNMMYPRLKLANNLLREDGAIFVSIADHEFHNLRLAMDEIFGAENFIATVIWHKMDSPKNTACHFSEDHDYVLAYAKEAEAWRPNGLERTEEMIARYKNPDNDPRGPWLLSDLAARNYYAQGRYPITTKTGRVISGPPAGSYWRISREKFDELESDNRIWWGEGGDNRPGMKRFLSEVRQGVVPQTYWSWKDVGSTRNAKQELSQLMGAAAGEDLFITPKPTKLVERMLQIGTSATENDVVLDFFGGSGTTGHATLSANLKDGGLRRHVLVQLPEPTGDPKLPTIAELTKERLRRAGVKLRAEWREKHPETVASPADSAQPNLFSLGSTGGSGAASDGSAPAASSMAGGASTTPDAGRGSPPAGVEEAAHFPPEASHREPDFGFRVFKLDTSNIREWRPKREDVAGALQANVDNLLDTRTEADILYELLLKLGLDLCVPITEKSLAGKKVHNIGGGALLACLDRRIAETEVEALGHGIVAWHKDLAPAVETRVIFRDSAFTNDVAKTNLAAILQQNGLTDVRSL